MAKDLEEALVNIEAGLGGERKPLKDLGEHLEYIEGLIGGGGGSSGGKVDDVLINGESVLEDKIADIKLKTINGSQITGEGNVAITTYQPFSQSWPTTESTTAFCQAIKNDPAATVGMAYLGGARFTDLPFYGNGDIEVKIMQGPNASTKAIHLTCTSGDVAPYRWECTYWGTLFSGWKTIGSTEVSANPETTGEEADLVALQIGSTKYKVGGDVELLTKTTYADLVAARNGGQLVPGALYQITDYQATTAQSGTSAAANKFDIIVKADTASSLSETAYAAHHESDESGYVDYFANCDLNAWELKYSLDNDTDVFAWADATNGKGVVYYMKDEWGNECPYDFKNLKGNVGGTHHYTFDCLVSGARTDASLDGKAKGCYNNIIRPCVDDTSKKQKLPNIIMYAVSSATLNCHSNFFDHNCSGISTLSGCCANKFGVGCYNITLNAQCKSNIFMAENTGHTLSLYASGNTFGATSQNAILGSSSARNKIGGYCNNIRIGAGSGDNVIGDYCMSITLGDNCTCNVFGNGCAQIFFQKQNGSAALSYYRNNIFDAGCGQVYLWSTDTSASINNYLQNVHVHSKSNGTFVSIEVPDRNLPYELDYYLDENGDLVSYVNNQSEPADPTAMTELEVRRLFRTEYDITVSVTNGTYSGDSEIWTSETASVTIAPAAGYVLPSSITVSGASYTYDDATGVCELSSATGNVAISVVCEVAPPAKGDIISFDALGDGTQKRFRVVKADGGITTLMSMDNDLSAEYGYSATAQFDDGNTYADYATSRMNTAINTTYYNSLSAAVKAAIVSTPRIQSCYYVGAGSAPFAQADFNMYDAYNNNYRTYARQTQKTVGSLNCFALDLDDIKEYFGLMTGSVLSNDLVSDFLYEQTTDLPGTGIRFASAVTNFSNYAVYFNTNDNNANQRIFDILKYSTSRTVRPAFRIDLASIAYTKE